MHYLHSEKHYLHFEMHYFLFQMQVMLFTDVLLEKFTERRENPPQASEKEIRIRADPAARPLCRCKDTKYFAGKQEVLNSGLTCDRLRQSAGAGGIRGRPARPFGQTAGLQSFPRHPAAATSPPTTAENPPRAFFCPLMTVHRE